MNNLTLEEFTALVVLVNAMDGNGQVHSWLAEPGVEHCPKEIRLRLIELNYLNEEGVPNEWAVRLVQRLSNDKLPSFENIARRLTPSAIEALVRALITNLARRAKDGNVRAAGTFIELQSYITGHRPEALQGSVITHNEI